MLNTFEDAFGRTKTMNYLHFAEHSNFAANHEITKLILEINELSVTIYLSMPKTKTNLLRSNFGQPVNTE